MDEVEVACRQVVTVDRARRDREPGCQNGDVVAASGELGRLALDVLCDAAKLRVVVVADDPDPHVEDDRMAGHMTVT